MQKNSVVLITGASTGFGRLMAETLARRGYRVYASLRDTGGRNAEAARELEELGRGDGMDLRVVDLDVTDPASVERAVETVVQQAGRIDVLVNNAGIVQSGVSEGFTSEQTRRLFDVNFFGFWDVTRAVLPQMREQGSGLVVNVSTAISRVVLPFMGIYSASKGAMEALSESLRYELAPLGIDSILVEPGAYGTPILAKTMLPEDTDRVAEYGAVAEIPQKIGENLGGYLGGPDAPDPQAVADEVVGLIELPAGERPARTVVGNDVQAVRELNEASDRVQAALLDGFGVTPLLAGRQEATA